MALNLSQLIQSAGDGTLYSFVQANSASWDEEYLYLPLSGGTLTGNLSVGGTIAGNGSNITNLNASELASGTVNSLRMPSFNGDITTTSGSTSATVVAIQGEPISTQTPNLGQVLQWTGTAWTPGAIPNGGSGGGGLVYYLNFANQAQSPTTNLSATPNTPRELGAEGTVSASSVTINNVSTSQYDLICGFVSLTGSPNAVTIPAGLWDFNIWASATSTTTKQTSLLLNVYKYDGSNIPTLLASSGDIFIYDPTTTAQYIGSVVFPQTTLLETDRIYIELRAKATQLNKNITIYFGGTTPTHVHTTFPSVRGSGLVKVINGVYQSPASLLVDTDVASNANISQTKINGLTDVASKADAAYTTVQTNSATNWNKSKTIAFFTVLDNEPPATNFATLDTRNSHPVLDFDTTTQEAAVFRTIIPEGLSLTNGLTVFVQWAATSATTGTVGWDVAFERIVTDDLDIDGDSFGTPQTITAATVSSTSGVTKRTSVTFTQAQLPANLTGGDMIRIRIRRDVANDNAAGDAELIAVEVRSAA